MKTFAIIGLVCVSLVLTPSADAFVPRAGDAVHITETIRDDLYAAAGTVDVDAPIEGDITAAARTVSVSRSVSGAVLAVGGTVRIGGEVGRNVRAVAGKLTVSGPVGTDAVLAGGEVQIDQGARIGRDLVAAGGTVEVHGNVARDAFLSGGGVVLGGQVAGDVDVDADRLTVLSSARITGRLHYATEQPVDIQPGARIGGGAQQVGTRVSRPVPMTPLGFPFAGRLVEALWLLALGVAALAVFPHGTQRVVDHVARRFVMSLLAGFLICVAVPVAIVLVMVTVVGIPLGLAVLFMYIATLYPAQLFSAIWVGDRVLRFGPTSQPMRPYLALLIGTVLLVILVAIPWVGWVVRLVAVLVGFGALWSVIWTSRARPVTVATA